MILQGLTPELLARLLNLDRQRHDDSWLLFGLEPPPADDQEEALRWAAE